MYCIFQNLTQKMLDSKHDNKGAAGMRDVRSAFAGRAARARVEFEVRGASPADAAARAAHAVAWVTAAELRHVADVRVTRTDAGGGGAVGFAMAAEHPGKWAVDVALRERCGWTPALLLRALSPLLTGKRAPMSALQMVHAAAWGADGRRRARVVLLYPTVDAARTVAVALERKKLGFARDAEVKVEGFVARVACVAAGAVPGDARSGALTPLLSAPEVRDARALARSLTRTFFRMRAHGSGGFRSWASLRAASRPTTRGTRCAISASWRSAQPSRATCLPCLTTRCV